MDDPNIDDDKEALKNKYDKYFEIYNKYLTPVVKGTDFYKSFEKYHVSKTNTTKEYMTKRLAFKRALMYHYGIDYDKTKK